jgi:N-acyl-L-homoserine lactone synthetase
MRDGTGEWVWEMRAPVAAREHDIDHAAVPEWIEDVWRLRGLVLYDDGRRPQFLTAVGQFADRDPLDLVAYHVLGWCMGDLVGCIRFIPVTVAGLTERVLGRERFEDLLVALDTDRASTVEVGRWIVHPEFRRHRVALSLVGGCWSYVQSLGFRMAVATVGTRGKQDAILNRTGLYPVPGLAPHRSDAFDDELRTMYAVVREPAPNFRGMVEQMRERLADAAPEAQSGLLRESA